MPTCPACNLTLTELTAFAIDYECPRCGTTMRSPSDPPAIMGGPDEPVVSIVSEGDELKLEVVVLGDQTLEETSIIIALSTAAEIMRDCDDVPSVQMKDHYEALMQKFINWLAKNRRPQLSATMRKKL
jgi:hypothetical protein